jgi:hypothetical protein
MNDPQFTPGPWQFRPMDGFDALHKLRGTKPEEHEGYFRANDGSWGVSCGNGRVCLVDFQGKAKRGQGYAAPDPEGMANARLIAAAPEMYEALKRCVVELEFHADGHSLAEIEIANAAIAKAEGRAA